MKPEGGQGQIASTEHGEFLLATVDVPGGRVEVRALNLTWDAQQQTAEFDVYLANLSESPLSAPALLSIESIAPAGIEFLNPDGTTGDGLLYKEFDEEFGDDGQLDPGESSDTDHLRFAVSENLSFSVAFGLADAVGGSISGIVYRDRNGDGVQDAVDDGLAEVVVSLRPADSGEDGLVETTTDANGAYRFSGLEPGVFGVEVEVPADGVATTPSALTVALLESEDGVADYDDANFGIDLEDTFDCPDAQKLEIRLDTDDDFEPPATDPTSPSAELADLITNQWHFRIVGFDDTGDAAAFAHTFENLPSDICSAVLTIRLRSLGGSNDTIRLELVSQSPLIQGTWAWRSLIRNLNGGTWDYGDVQTFVLDLSDLPMDGTNILSALEDGDLDVVVEDDTSVDSMVLQVCSDCAPSAN